MPQDQETCGHLGSHLGRIAPYLCGSLDRLAGSEQLVEEEGSQGVAVGSNGVEARGLATQKRGESFDLSDNE